MAGRSKTPGQAERRRLFPLALMVALKQKHPMNWFYAINGQQHGPVSEEQLDALIAAGTVTATTLVWREGMAGWQPLQSARTAATGAAQGHRCVECGGHFSDAEMVFLNRAWVCARCKPLFIQRMSEGGAPPSPTGLLWRTGRQLVFAKDTPFPDRCVCCNTPTNLKLKRQLYWHPSGYYLLILISILVYAVAAIIVRKKALVHIGLCDRHRSMRRRTIAGS